MSSALPAPYTSICKVGSLRHEDSMQDLGPKNSRNEPLMPQSTDLSRTNPGPDGRCRGHGAGGWHNSGGLSSWGSQSHPHPHPHATNYSFGHQPNVCHTGSPMGPLDIPHRMPFMSSPGASSRILSFKLSPGFKCPTWICPQTPSGAPQLSEPSW